MPTTQRISSFSRTQNRPALLQGNFLLHQQLLEALPPGHPRQSQPITRLDRAHGPGKSKGGRSELRHVSSPSPP